MADRSHQAHSRISDLKERGSELIELALVIPMFIALVFAVVDCTRVALAQTAVRSAVQLSLRRSAAPDRPDWPVFQTLNTGASPYELDLHPEFRSAGGQNGWYLSRASTQGITGRLSSGETRALAYAYRAIGLSVGTIQFPCSGVDCVSCFTLRGHNLLNEVTSPIGDRSSGELVGLECSYSLRILSTSLLGGWLPSVYTVRGQAFENVDERYSG